MANPAHDPAGSGAESTDALLQELANRNGLARKKAREQLVDIGRPAVPGLIQALSSSNQDTRWEAAKALSELHDPSAAPALVKALEDNVFGVRWLAAEALIGLRQSAVVPVLKALVGGSRSAWLRDGAHHVLAALAKETLTDELKPVLKALEGTQPADEAPVAAGLVLQKIAGPESRSQGYSF